MLSVKSTWNLRCHKGMTMIKYTDSENNLQIIGIDSIINESRLIIKTNQSKT